MTVNDDGSQGNESVSDGIFEAVAEANHEVYASRGQLDKAAKDPASTGEVGGGTPTKQKQKEADPEDEGDNVNGLDTQDFSRQSVPSTTETESNEEAAPSQGTEGTETKTNPDTEFDWQSGLPTDPGDFKIEAPKPNEEGQIDPEEYGDYLLQKFDHQSKVNDYNSKVITATFDAVDKILPEVNENPAFQAAIRSTYYSTLSPEETVAMAKSLRETVDKIAGQNKAAGYQSAKTSITVQKAAGVESKGASQKKSTDSSKTDNLTKRLAKNDTAAFEELMGDWLQEGKV